MKLCRFERSGGPVVPGLILADGRLLDLSAHGIATLAEVFESAACIDKVDRLARSSTGAGIEMKDVRLAPPVDRQEVWAAGVTYLRSKKARMEESDFSAKAYDRVYEAERPEIFFKSLAEKVVTTGAPVGIRRDARWSVPEPELVLIFNSKAQVSGFSIGNDMSSRDIEGENLLYLPQAKIYRNSCSIRPWVVVGPTEAEAREWSIKVEIRRQSGLVFSGETSVGQLRREFAQLGEFLFRSQQFPHGVALLTGTGVVPPDSFTLAAGDEIAVAISGIGQIVNRVEVV